jgi:hypothetical protein
MIIQPMLEVSVASSEVIVKETPLLLAVTAIAIGVATVPRA